MKLVALLVLAASLGCTRSPAAPTGAEGGTPAAAVAAAAPSGPARGEALTFAGAEGWTGGRSCTDVRPEDHCASQWLHSSGQVVRVFVVEVKDASALERFVDNLAKDVTGKGGVVDRFSENGLTLVRFLQRVKGDDGAALASINYALVGRDKTAVHLITSIVAFEDQRAADGRLRALLDSASWTR